MIDGQNFSGALLRFQFQAELVLHRREDRRLTLALILCPLQRKVVVVGETSLIQHGTAQVILV